MTEIKKLSDVVPGQRYWLLSYITRTINAIVVISYDPRRKVCNFRFERGWNEPDASFSESEMPRRKIFIREPGPAPDFAKLFPQITVAPFRNIKEVF